MSRPFQAPRWLVRALLVALPVAGLAGSLRLGFGARTGPVLHEDVPAPEGASASVVGPAPAEGQNPQAFAAGDKMLPEPAAEAPTDGEPVLGDGGFAADRRTEDTADYDTGKEGTLHYVSVFNPDVLPFKRMTSLDKVMDDYHVVVADPTRTPVPVGGATDPARDRFWGDVLIKLEPGVPVPLPSVAPDMRILSYEADPPIKLVFSRDGADNFWVSTSELTRGRPRRLRFMADADSGYFVPTLPSSKALPAGTRMTARQVARVAPAAYVQALPPNVARDAAITLKQLNIDRDMALSVSFNRLVAYFRAFEGKNPPAATGDMYRDLVDAQAGVCRHRSWAFMITSTQLGIPTRLVENEAHVFVEVWFPGRGWQRVDLGGSAMQLDVTNGNDKTLHRPRGEDALAKPPEYKDDYTQLNGAISGLTDAQLADKHKPLDEAPASGSDGVTTGAGAGAGASGGPGDDPAGAPPRFAGSLDPGAATTSLPVDPR